MSPVMSVSPSDRHAAELSLRSVVGAEADHICYQVGGQSRQAIILAFCPTIFDRDAATLHEASLIQRLTLADGQRTTRAIRDQGTRSPASLALALRAATPFASVIFGALAMMLSVIATALAQDTVRLRGTTKISGHYADRRCLVGAALVEVGGKQHTGGLFFLRG
jgi:hypothetical protein